MHVVTDDRVLARPDLLQLAGRIVRAGPGVALHLRGPRSDGRTLHRLASELRRRAPEVRGMLVVNDRVDVALAAAADAVQLGGGSLRPGGLPAAATGLRVGVSVHGSPGAAEAQRADWLILGTIFPTPSHPGRSGGGHALVAEVAAGSTVPIIAIGGITPGRVRDVLRAGAHGVAVLRGVWDVPDPVEAVHRYLSEVAPDAGPDEDRDADPGANPDANPDRETVP